VWFNCLRDTIGRVWTEVCVKIWKCSYANKERVKGRKSNGYGENPVSSCNGRSGHGMASLGLFGIACNYV